MIVRIMAGDLAAIVSCAQAAFRAYIDRIGQEPAPMHADYAQLPAQGDVFVLSDGGALYGFVVLHVVLPELHLETIAVDPVHQGRGYGRQLLAFVEGYAQALSLAAISLYTNELMTENIALYRRRGFEEVARRTEDGFRRVFMVKQLHSSRTKHSVETSGSPNTPRTTRRSACCDAGACRTMTCAACSTNVTSAFAIIRRVFALDRA